MQFGVWLRRALSPCDQVGQCRANRSPILSDIVSKDQNATRSRGRLHRGSVPSRHASEASDLGRSAAETEGAWLEPGCRARAHACTDSRRDERPQGLASPASSDDDLNRPKPGPS